MKIIAKDSLQGLKASWDSTIVLDRIAEDIESNLSAIERLRRQQKMEDSMNHIARRWFNAVSDPILYRIGKITSTSPKVKYEMITIKPKRVETVITDFGVTYY